MDNMQIYNAVRRPPENALKKIVGGRIGGMTDINPQWRIEALTEQFGPIGKGWYYEITRLWLEPVLDKVAAFAEIKLFVKYGDEWSKPISGSGGSMFLAQESKGPYVSDECYKMAITDAMSVACKGLGIGGDIYAGRWDGSKYVDSPEAPATKPAAKEQKPAEAKPPKDAEQFELPPSFVANGWKPTMGEQSKKNLTALIEWGDANDATLAACARSVMAKKYKGE